MAEQPLKDIIVVMRDTGMRNARELYCMRVENVDAEATPRKPCPVIFPS